MGTSIDSASSCNDLIVDFPQHYIEPPSPEGVSVRFSPLAEVKLFQSTDDSDASKLYFTKDDYLAFRIENVVRVVNKVFLEMKSSKSQVPMEGYDYTLTGIEKILIPNNVTKTIQRRKEHRWAVFEQQQRQREFGKSSPVMIALKSRCHSVWDAKRAQQIGSEQRIRALG